MISWFSGWSSGRGQTVTCDCGIVFVINISFDWIMTHQMRFWGRRRPQQKRKKATKVITPILEVISSNIFQSKTFQKSLKAQTTNPYIGQYHSFTCTKCKMLPSVRATEVSVWSKISIFSKYPLFQKIHFFQNIHFSKK